MAAREESYWTCRDGKGQFCGKPATHALKAPDGNIIGKMCAEHAQEVIDEYWRLLGEAWEAVPLTEGGQILRPASGDGD